MTMSIWAAVPPEVHSAALFSGPGPGSLLAAEEAWQSLSAEYDSAAQELSAVLAAVQAGTWQGPSAEAFVAAHVPYLAWLLQNSANSSAAALEHDTVIAAYTAALTAMPTLQELEANHAIHAELVATNFFGVNAIPIALNEIDYLRMWLQAATTMAMYEAVSQTALTWKPPTSPPPPIQRAGASHDAGPGPTHLSWWVTRVEEISKALNADLAQSSSNPSAPLAPLLSDPLLVSEVSQWAGEAVLSFTPQLTQLTQVSYALIAPFIALPAVGGLAGLAGLAGVSQTASPTPGVVAAPAPSDTGAPVALASGPGVPAAAAPTAAASAPTVSTPAPSAQLATPPAAGVPGFSYPYVVGPPGLGAGETIGTAAAAEQKAPEPDTVASVAAAAVRDRALRRRRLRPGQVDPGYRHEYLDQDSRAQAGGDPQLVAAVGSARGAGTMGFAGTTHPAGAGQAAGLTTLPGDSLGGDPRMPMVPGSWASETGGPAAKMTGQD